MAQHRSAFERCMLSNDPDELREWIDHLEVALSWAINVLDPDDPEQASVRAQLEKMLNPAAVASPKEMAAEWSHGIYEALLPVTEKLRDADANGFDVRLRCPDRHEYNFVVEVRPKGR